MIKVKERFSKLEDIKAVIFDLDGTLIDTEKIYRQLWPQSVREMGYDMKDEHYLQMRSLGRPFAPAKMKEWFGEDFDYDGARKIRSGHFNKYLEEHGIERKKGAIELLEYLKQKDIIIAIATATDIERATSYLEMTELNGYFDKVISATMVKEGKPSPDVYLYACSQLGLKPSECVAVEDAPNGILSAYRSGCHVIMVPDQTGMEEYLKDKVEYCVDSLEDICNIL